MEQLKHKEALREAIGGWKVKAVLINTFNFDPVFFENYLMPLFVGDVNYDFGDNQIHNHILWRRVAKNNGIPPISIYCDFYAKDSTYAPSLGYDVFCVKTPCIPHQITNFHPKIMLILLEENKKEKLLLNIGSGNLTINGWCTNVEAFAIEVIKQNKSQPNSKKTNALQDFLNGIQEMSNSKIGNDAQEFIYKYLKKVEEVLALHHSINGSLQDFFSQRIPMRKVEKIEIVSPFFSTEPTLLKWLTDETGATTTALLPTLKSNEITISEKSFDNHTAGGIKWALWNDKSKREKSLNDELRNLHAKIYRFYTERKMYTFLGSANFTNPAWGKISQSANKSNVEIGWLCTVEEREGNLLKEKNIDKNDYRFIELEKEENNEIISESYRNAPEITFTIDWENKTLLANNKEKKGHYHFSELIDDSVIDSGTNTYNLSATEIRKLARNTLIKVVFKNQDRDELYCFYPREINFMYKPLGFRVSTYTILKFWDNLGNDLMRNKLIEQYSDSEMPDSGIVSNKDLEQKSILNEMGRHFYSLIKLENYLFKDCTTIKDANSQLQLMNHYLLHTSLDSVSNFRNELKDKLENKEIQNSFYWMILQILFKHFYDCLDKSIAYKVSNETKLKRKMSKQFKVIAKELQEESESIKRIIPNLDKKAEWVVKEI